MPRLTDRIKHAWNAFVNQEAGPFGPNTSDYGPSYSYRPDRLRLRWSNERSIISSINNRVSVDCASVDIRHVRLDDNERYVSTIDSGLNNCFNVEANIDQAATAFKLDIVNTMLDKGVAAIVPIDTDINPEMSGSFDIKTLRVGEIIDWFPKHIRVSLYNEKLGRREQLIVEKRIVAIAENPLYRVMNEPNSTLQRLIKKLNLLDVIDDQSSSGKLDIIIQLPYVIKSEARKQQAEQRRKDIEFQLQGSKYGIAYTDGTEKITQLNRPAENNLLKQIEYLTTMLYGQLGLTEEVMNGTANEETMLNYQNRTILPILTAIVESMRRTFLTKTARSQLQSIEYFNDPFRLVPINNIAEIADKFTRNEIMSANEIRAVIGLRPSTDPKAEELRNSNMPMPDANVGMSIDEEVEDGASDVDMDSIMQDAFGEIETALSDVFGDLGIDEDADTE